MSVVTWRLVLDRAGDGPANMATDEAILNAVAAGCAPPTIRFYRWQAPWLSLGYGQRKIGDLLDRCREAGVGVVRRITGGRAVLHNDEVTYCLVAPINLRPEFGTITSSYRLFSQALALGLSRLGIAAKRDAAEGPRRSSCGQMCFAVALGADLRVGGAKLVGSAQARKSGVLLQQGSLLVSIDWDLNRRIFGQEAARAQNQGYVACLSDLCPGLGADAILPALLVGFGEVLGPLQEAALSGGERSAARELAARKYRSFLWTLGYPPRGSVDVLPNG